MEAKERLNQKPKSLSLLALTVGLLGIVYFTSGITVTETIYSRVALAEDQPQPESQSNSQSFEPAPSKKGPKVVYPKKTELDFEGAQIEGQLQNPGEFYFQHKPEDKFDTLVKRRKNFHREMLRDAVLTK